MLRRYVPGPGVDEPLVWYEGSGTGDRRWLHADERGSVIAVSDGAGTALAINRYDEYGIPQSGNAGRFQYTGQAWLPELGMYYYKARMYSPTLSRFLQTDPIGYGDGLNWYNYVSGDPINRTDPSGQCSFSWTNLYKGFTDGSMQFIGTADVRTWDCDRTNGDSQRFRGQGSSAAFERSNEAGSSNKLPQNEKKLPGCLQSFLKGRLQSNPADITLHRGSPFDLTGNSVTFGNDINLAGNMFDRTDRGAEIHKFHEIQHTSQYARGYSALNQAFAYVAFGGHDASPFEQAADKFAQDTYDAYKAAGLDKTCPF